MRSTFFRKALGISLAALCFGAGPASADVIGFSPQAAFTGSMYTFSYLGQSFTLSDNGSGFPSPVSASTTGTAMYAKDFFGISVFFDPPRGRLVFDSGYQYASYPIATRLSFSATPSIIGLALTAADGVHYGYAEFAGTFLQSYAFETRAGVGIEALAPIALAIPEPSGIALLGLGALGLVLLGRRKRAIA